MTPSRTHIAIVGAGIAGLSLAWRLAGRTQVTLLEAGALGARGASSVPAALLNPFRGRTARAHPDDLAGLAAFWRRDEVLRSRGHDTGSLRTGVLRIASDAGQADLFQAQRGQDGPHWIPTGEVPTAYHAPHGAVLVRDGGWIRSARLLAALGDDVRTHGVDVREHARVERFERVGGGAGGWRLELADRSVPADIVVWCPGAEPVPGPHAPVGPFQRLEGDVITLAAEPAFPYPVAGAVYGAADSGRAWVGGNHREAGTPDPGAATSLRRSFGWFVPAVRGAEIASVWSGVRLKQKSLRPLAAELADGLWFLGAFAGRGFLCSALEADRLAVRLGLGA